MIWLRDPPPTTNKLYFNAPGKGRRRTLAYRRWLWTAGWELQLQKVLPLRGLVALEIRLPDRPGRAPDADNALKASIDLLVTHRLIDGDDKSVVRSVTVQWDETSSIVHIVIRRATPARTQPDEFAAVAGKLPIVSSEGKE